MKTAIFSTLALASVAVAIPSPLVKRADIDTTILNYALTLEHLEAAFYKAGLAKFTEAQFKTAGYTDKNFYKHLQEISADESSHVDVLTSLINSVDGTPVAACTYNFGLTTPKAFMTTATVLEGVGVSAYLGAAALITNTDYITAAGSILTVEARHNAFIRKSRSWSPFPQAYDAPLGFDQVYSLAAGFIKSCPSSNPSLPVKAFPALTVKSAIPYLQGNTITYAVPSSFTFPAASVPLYIAFPLSTGSVFANATIDRTKKTITAVIPAGGITGPAGQSYAILTNSSTAATDDTTLAGPAVIDIQAPYLLPQ